MRLRLRTQAARAGAPGALAAAVGAVVLYAVFAHGAIGLRAQARVEVALAVVALGAFAALLPGRLRVRSVPLGWAGAGLLAAFALWAGQSLGWSRAPDETWVELNRAVAYALAPLLGLVLGTSLRRAPERVAHGYLAIAVAAALYALAGKALPGLLDHTAEFSRLREPLGYWNALALLCAMAVPAAVRLAADPGHARPARTAATLALVPLLTALSLTYSRGGFLALAVALAVLIGAGPDRLRLAAFAAAGAAGCLPALAVAFLRDDLTADGLSVSARSDDGLMLLAALLAGAALAALLGSWAIAAGDRLRLGERFRHRAARLVPATLVAALAGVVIGLALSDRGLSGSVSQEWSDFKAVKFERQDDPGRILRTSSGNRWVWWSEAVDAWRERPLEGAGAGSFPLLHLLHRDNELPVRQAHSVPLELLAETGLVGALLALAGVALLAAAAVRGPPGRPCATALGAACAAWTAHALIDWDWDIPGVTLPLLVFLGVLAARPAAGEPRSPRRRRAVLALGVLLAAAIALSALLPSLARDRTDAALRAAARGSPGDLERAAEDAETAADLDPLALEPLLAGATIAERRGRYAQERELLTEAVERNLHDPRGWTALARFDLLIGDHAAALHAARRALALDPRDRRLRALPALIAAQRPRR